MQKVYLQPLQEAVGVLEEPIHEEGGVLIVTLSNHNGSYALMFNKESPEAEAIRKKLSDDLVGQRIAIFRSPSNCIFVRKIE